LQVPFLPARGEGQDQDQVSQQFLSDNMNIAEQNCGLHALIIDMWK